MLQPVQSTFTCEISITNDSATILKSIQLDNAAAKISANSSQVVDDEVGDGTSTVCVLAGGCCARRRSLSRPRSTRRLSWRDTESLVRWHLKDWRGLLSTTGTRFFASWSGSHQDTQCGQGDVQTRPGLHRTDKPSPPKSSHRTSNMLLNSPSTPYSDYKDRPTSTTFKSLKRSAASFVTHTWTLDSCSTRRFLPIAENAHILIANALSCCFLSLAFQSPDCV